MMMQNAEVKGGGGGDAANSELESTMRPSSIDFRRISPHFVVAS